MLGAKYSDAIETATDSYTPISIWLFWEDAASKYELYYLIMSTATTTDQTVLCIGCLVSTKGNLGCEERSI